MPCQQIHDRDARHHCKKSGIVYDCRGPKLVFDKGEASQPVISPVEYDLQPGIDVEAVR